MNDCHDYALACTHHLYDLVYAVLRPDEREPVFDEIYARVKDTLELFALEARSVQRLTPGDN